jgi:hypothetical protein
VDVILLDWTRMGRQFCLAGAVVQDGEIRVVRPLPRSGRNPGAPNAGWSPYLLHGHGRWQVFEMVKPAPGDAAPPHLEDVWVHGLRPTPRVASPEQRRAILRATLAADGQPPFGAALTCSYTGSYLEPGLGQRSLVSVLVPSREVHFSASWREGAGEPDYRVSVPVPGLGPRIIPVKDHFLLCRAELEARDVERRVRFLDEEVRRMGESVVARLGLSRAFACGNGQPGRCWLMADGFFSPDDPRS